MPLTRMPCSPSSAASSRTWWAWSAFVARVGDVVRPGEHRVLRRRCRRCRRRGPGRSCALAAACETRKLPLAITSCWRSQSRSVVSSSGLEIDRPALLTTRSMPPKASTRRVDRGLDRGRVGDVGGDADRDVGAADLGRGRLRLVERRGRRSPRTRPRRRAASAIALPMPLRRAGDQRDAAGVALRLRHPLQLRLLERPVLDAELLALVDRRVASRPPRRRASR